MYKPINITQDIFYVGVNDRQKQAFENMIPLTHGVSYNSFIIADEKVALIDTVDICFIEKFLQKIEAAIGDRPIDYLIVNHMEPDHSGSIHLIRQRYPNIQIVGNAKTFDMLAGYYNVTGNTHEVKEGDTLDLGKHKLTFYMAPMVHWPEVMMAYDSTDKVLFSADAFGCFGTLNGGVIDTQICLDEMWDEMYRYYANIITKYGVPVQKALQKLQALEIDTICSTHGPVWTEHKQKAIEIYDRLSRFEGEEGVVIAYGSMYGNTEAMAEAIAQGLVENGVKKVIVHNMSRSDVTQVLSDVLRYKGLIMGCPTYINEVFPKMSDLMTRIENKAIQNRLFGYFGSFTWAGAAVRNLTAFSETMKWEVVTPPVEMKQGITPAKFEECYNLGKAMAERVKN